MKNTLLTLVIATGLAAVIANTPALAQTNHTATVPFAFAAGGAEYPAGDYAISNLNRGTNWIVKLTNLASLRTRFVSIPIPLGEATGSPKLVFQANAGGYRLSEVWLQGIGMKTADSLKNSEAASVKVAIR